MVISFVHYCTHFLSLNIALFGASHVFCDGNNIFWVIFLFLEHLKQFQEQNLIPSPSAKAPERHHQSTLERNFEMKLIRETSILSLRDYYLMHYEKSIPKEGNFSSYGLLVPNAWLALKDSKNNKNPCSFKLISFYRVSMLKMELSIKYYSVDLNLLLELWAEMWTDNQQHFQLSLLELSRVISE